MPNKILSWLKGKKEPKTLEEKIALYREFDTYLPDEIVVPAQNIHIPKLLPSEPPEGIEYHFEATGYFTKSRNQNYCTIPTEWRNVNNYCHWTLTEIPILALAFESAAPTLVIADRLLNVELPFQKRWLEILRQAFPDKEVLPLSANEDKINGILPVNQDTSLARHLIGKCEYTWYHRSRATTYTIQLMETMKPHFAPTQNFESQKIYINRRNRRRLQNEEEVQAFLKSQGFVIINLEDLTLDNQVALFSQAAVIVGFHGAGLCNLVFSTASQKIIEIVDEDCVYPSYKDGLVKPGHKATRTHFHMIAHMKGLNYSAIESDNYLLDLSVLAKAL